MTVAIGGGGFWRFGEGTYCSLQGAAGGGGEHASSPLRQPHIHQVTRILIADRRKHDANHSPPAISNISLGLSSSLSRKVHPPARLRSSSSRSSSATRGGLAPT